MKDDVEHFKKLPFGHPYTTYGWLVSVVEKIINQDKEAKLEEAYTQQRAKPNLTNMVFDATKMPKGPSASVLASITPQNLAHGASILEQAIISMSAEEDDMYVTPGIKELREMFAMAFFTQRDQQVYIIKAPQ